MTPDDIHSAPATGQARDDAAKHTPGPWHVEDPLGPDILSIVASGPEAYEWKHVAQISTTDETDEIGDEIVIAAEDARANARLIAAAPDLYAALLRLDTFWTGEHPKGPEDPERTIGRLSDETVSIWRQIRAALALATREPSHV